MKKLLILSFLCIYSLMHKAQSVVQDYANKVVLCEDYNISTGEPTGVGSNWTVKSTGSNVYVVYNSSTTIKEMLTLDVKKRNASSGTYEFYGSYYMSYDSKSPKKYAMYDMKFLEAGKYSLAVKNNKGKTLSETSAEIDVDDEKMKTSTTSTTSNSDDEVDTYYYEDSKIQFGKDVSSNGDIIDENSVFYLREGKASVAVLFIQSKPFKTNTIYVDIFDSQTNKQIDTKTFDAIDKGWDWIKVNLSFNKRGKYYIEVYNGSDIYINTSSTFEIK